MQNEDIAKLEERLAKFDIFYEELIPALVEFVSRLGISPAHEVLNNATLYSEIIGNALNDIVIENEDRIWLISRLGFFIGEYYCQKFGGNWFVNDLKNSRYFAKYVVGKFSNGAKIHATIDPFDVAQTYVDTKPSRNLVDLLALVDEELRLA